MGLYANLVAIFFYAMRYDLTKNQILCYILIILVE